MLCCESVQVCLEQWGPEAQAHALSLKRMIRCNACCCLVEEDQVAAVVMTCQRLERLIS